MKTYIFYDSNGRLLRTESRKDSIVFTEPHIILEGRVDVDYGTQKVVNGRLVNKTDAEIIQEKQEQDAIRLQERKQDVLQTKSLYLAAKSESPALVEYLKLTGVIPSDMDDLIK